MTRPAQCNSMEILIQKTALLTLESCKPVLSNCEFSALTAKEMLLNRELTRWLQYHSVQILVTHTEIHKMGLEKDTRLKKSNTFLEHVRLNTTKITAVLVLCSTWHPVVFIALHIGQKFAHPQ